MEGRGGIRNDNRLNGDLPWGWMGVCSLVTRYLEGGETRFDDEDGRMMKLL